MTRQFRASLFVAVTALVGLHFKPCIGTMFGAVSEALACTAAACQPEAPAPAVDATDDALPDPDAASARPTLASLALRAGAAAPRSSIR